jgi:hypothetical protein
VSHPCADRSRRALPLALPGLLAALALSRVVIALGLGEQDQPPAPPSALRACADIAADAARLACYDRLAGRAGADMARATPAATTPATPSPTAGPAANPAVPTPPPVPQPAAAAPPSAATAAGAAAMPAQPSTQSFGMYAAEHPTPPPVAKSLQAAVVALGRSPSGRMTVALEGGALWELDEADPLLGVGDVVTIARASFTSYIMSTPTRRTHHVRRLR